MIDWKLITGNKIGVRWWPGIFSLENFISVWINYWNTKYLSLSINIYMHGKLFQFWLFLLQLNKGITMHYFYLFIFSGHIYHYLINWSKWPHPSDEHMGPWPWPMGIQQEGLACPWAWKVSSRAQKKWSLANWTWLLVTCILAGPSKPGLKIHNILFLKS